MNFADWRNLMENGMIGLVALLPLLIWLTFMGVGIWIITTIIKLMKERNQLLRDIASNLESMRKGE
jgi:type IV secretory pathway TrbD component